MNETEQIFILNGPASQPSGSTQKMDNVENPATSQVNLENVEDFSHVCRTCATITEFVIPIFEGEGLQNNLADKIHKHLPIQVGEGDVLPRVVCYQCASTLLAWHELVQCCVQADAALRARLAALHQGTKATNVNPTVIIEEETQSKAEAPEQASVRDTEVQQDNTTDTELKEVVDKPEFIIIENGKRYAKCGECGKCVSLGSWRRHARAHRGERRYSCHTCGLAFSDSGNLARHARALHARLRPHACARCHKTFSRKSHLDEHARTHAAARAFVCHVCGAASKSGAALRSHARLHAPRARACLHCGALFRRAAELRAHVRVHTGEAPHACACGRAFRLRTQLTTHARTHQHTPLLQQLHDVHDGADTSNTLEPLGSVEDTQFTGISEYVAQSVEGAQYRPCSYCASSHHQSLYREHLVTAHADLLFHCEECNKYIDRKDFILHMSLHALQYTAGHERNHKRKKVKKKKEEDDNQSTSDVTEHTANNQLSNKHVNQENEFSDHSDMEYGFGPLPESVFEAIEDSQDSQPLEEDAAHSPENERLSDESSKSAQPTTENSNSSYTVPTVETSELSNNIAPTAVDSSNINNPATNQPMITINPIQPNDDSFTNNTAAVTNGVSDSEPAVAGNKQPRKPRTCPICSKVYTASSSYFYHMKYFHKRSREHACGMCDKKFGTRASLAQHKATHSGHYEFECKQCKKHFKSKASLYIHEQIHIGKKSWSCNQCHTSFRWKTHLSRHMSRHAAERRHVCATCARAFSVRADLLRHARTHAQGDHTCDKCGHKFGQLRYLKVHTLRKHSTNIVQQSQ